VGQRGIGILPMMWKNLEVRPRRSDQLVAEATCLAALG
jgi:hypothetical protein